MISAKNGLCRSETSTPTLKERRWTRLRATALGRYPSCSAATSTASRLSRLTVPAPRSTRETTDLETPARPATSRIVGGRSGCIDLSCGESTLDNGLQCIILPGVGNVPTQCLGNVPSPVNHVAATGEVTRQACK